MIIRTATFVKSSMRLEQCPASTAAEFAFIGRSNVGKSSLINMITGFNGLAKVSQTPGKTRTINHFIINDEWLIADLPGYGYAKVSHKQRENWWKETENYMLHRDNLVCLFVLIDSRIPPQDADLEFMEMLGMKQVPFARVFTKSDKLKANELTKALKQYDNRMLEAWEDLPPTFITSSAKRRGREEVLDFIEQSINIFKNPGKI